jgi:antirestriction protein ArdC
MGRTASVSRSASSSVSQAGDGLRLSPAERVTSQIADLLKRGVRPWVRPWDDGGSGLPLELPLRSCGTAYRGMNIVALWAAAMERGFQARHWFTFKQALALDACVRKGERGSFVVFYSELEAKDGDGFPGEEQDGGEVRRILRGYTVFNAEQIDGLGPQFQAPEPVAALPASDGADARFAELFARVPALVREGGTRALYSLAGDVIQMPPRAAFADRTQFWATLAHELSHWTRHPSRLDRDFGQTRFGDPAYALEELVAELSAAFIGAQIGLPADHLEDHAAYIGSWLKALSDNPSAFLTAAGKAQAAADYVLGSMGVPR